MASVFIGASLVALALCYGAVVIAAALSAPSGGSEMTRGLGWQVGVGVVVGLAIMATHWWGW